MKRVKIIIFGALIMLQMSCNDEVELYDYTKYKYVSFIDQEYTVSETYAQDAADEGKPEEMPIYLQYDGSTLEEDFSVELSVIGNNLEEGIDYSLSSKTVNFKAGSIASEPIHLTIIDNLVNSDEDKNLVMSIISVSNPNINIGVGMVNQSNKELTIHILDNECSETIDIFNSSELINSTEWGDYTITGSVSNEVLKVTGDLISYGSFPNANLEINLTPAVVGATTGTASFDDYEAGTDNDGYDYLFKQVGEGSYDVCIGNVTVQYEVYYESGGNWVYWYTVTNSINLP